MEIEYELDPYKVFGLNKYRAWLKPWQRWGGFEDQEVLIEVLQSAPDLQPAAMLVGRTNLVCAFIDYNRNGIMIVKGKLTDIDMFQKLDAKYDFKLCQLLICTEGGEYITL